MFGFASDFATAQTTEQLAATSATACYKRPDQHVSQVAATHRALGTRIRVLHASVHAGAAAVDCDMRV